MPPSTQYGKKQRILHINAGITHDSITCRVANEFVEYLMSHYHNHVQDKHGNEVVIPRSEILEIEELDVWSDKLPKFDRETMQAVWRARNNSQDENDIAAFKPIQELAAQILAADFLIITCPVWNFSVPYVLKQYIDCIVQPGLTFHEPDEQGPSRPYFKNRPLIVITSSGGKAPPKNEDYVFPFLARIFAMCGFDESYNVPIEGLSTHDKQVCYEQACKQANSIADEVIQNHKLKLVEEN